jgi:hypothetical protein
VHAATIGGTWAELVQHIPRTGEAALADPANRPARL